MAIILALGRSGRKTEQEFKVSLDYIANVRPAWNATDLVSKHPLYVNEVNNVSKGIDFFVIYH